MIAPRRSPRAWECDQEPVSALTPPIPPHRRCWSPTPLSHCAWATRRWPSALLLLARMPSLPLCSSSHRTTLLVITWHRLSPSTSLKPSTSTVASSSSCAAVHKGNCYPKTYMGAPHMPPLHLRDVDHRRQSSFGQDNKSTSTTRLHCPFLTQSSPPVTLRLRRYGISPSAEFTIIASPLW
jgi:hypothetical protein